MIEYSIVRISQKVQINVYVLLYRCELLALVLTYLIKYMTFLLLFTLT